MLLTSYQRIRRYLATISSSSTSQYMPDNYVQKQNIMNWITTVSMQVRKYLNRTLQIDSYTEYFDTHTNKDVQFFVSAYPIITLTDVYIEPEGKWDGAESEIDDCIIGKDYKSAIIPTPPTVLGYKTIRVRYTGGLAYSGVQSLFAITPSGAWTVNNFCYGGTSEAVGIVKSYTATTLTIEILYGVFVAGETLTEYSDEGLTTATGSSATLDTITRQSLVEQYPDIVRAAEIQIRYFWKHKDDFELSSTNKDGTNQRISSSSRKKLIEEAAALLDPYRNRAYV